MASKAWKTFDRGDDVLGVSHTLLIILQSDSDAQICWRTVPIVVFLFVITYELDRDEFIMATAMHSLLKSPKIVHDDEVAVLHTFFASVRASSWEESA